jgi:hypothetical protein
MNKIRMDFPASEQSHIVVFDNALNIESCQTVIDFALNNSDKVLQAGKTYGGVQPLTKNSMDMPMTDNHLVETFGEFPNFLHHAERVLANDLHLAIAMYEQKYPEIHLSNGWQDSGFNFQLYTKGIGFYRRHTDSNPVAEASRVLGVIMYLNTVDQGGGTEFPLHGVTVEAIAGRVCIFPAIWTHPHIGIMPISNDKCIISTFLKVSM